MNPRIAKLTERRDAIKAQLDSYDTQVIERSADLEGSEAANYTSLSTELEKVVGDIEEVSKREALINRSITAASSAGVTVSLPAQAKAAASGELIYRSSGDSSPLTDLIARSGGNPEASGRINAHNEAAASPLLRSSGTSNLGGLIVPSYVTEDFAPIARVHKPLVEAIGTRPLTAYSLVLSKATTGFATGVPTAQGGAYTSADIATAAINLTASTISGVAELAKEAVKFGAYDQGTLFQDIHESFWNTLDYLLFHGSDAAGQFEGIFASDGVNTQDGTNVNTFAELYSSIAEAASKVWTAIKAPATHVIMTSARWSSLQATTDTEGRPLLGWNGSAPQNVGGQFDAQTFAGLNVVVDDNIVVNAGSDTKVIVARLSEYRLYSDNNANPTVLQYDEVKAANGLVQFVGEGYAAFTAERRPGATTIISSLAVPTFPAAAA